MKTNARQLLVSGCRFCNGDTQMLYSEEYENGYKHYYVKCWDCGAQGPIKSSPELAKKAWRGEESIREE